MNLPATAVQLVGQFTNDPKFKGSNPAASGMNEKDNKMFVQDEINK